jgi:hypothetical protein
VQELKEEGIDGSAISFTDNSNLLNMLIGQPVGLLNLVDEQSRFPNADDMSLVEKLATQLGGYKTVQPGCSLLLAPFALASSPSPFFFFRCSFVPLVSFSARSCSKSPKSPAI